MIARHRRSKSPSTARYLASIRARVRSHSASKRCRSVIRQGPPAAPSGHRPKASHMAARWMSSAPSISLSRSRAISSRPWVGRAQSGSDWACPAGGVQRAAIKQTAAMTHAPAAPLGGP